MGLRLIARGFASYGLSRVRGKAAAVFLLLAAAFGPGPGIAGADDAQGGGDNGPVTVLAMGDSLTQGYGLPEAEGFVPQLRDWLRDAGAEAQVINAGVSGDTSAGGAARAGWSLTEEIDAMILALGANDMLRGIDPAVTRANLAAIIETAAERGVPVLLVGMRAPGNFGPDYKRAFDTLYPELAEAHGTLYFEDFFAGLGAGAPADLQRFFQPDGLHPNARGVARIVAAMGPDVLRLIAAAR